MSELSEFLKSHSIEFRDRGVNVGREFVNICCPFCQEIRYHCGIHETKFWWKCWVCGKGGSWWKLKKQLKENYPQIPWDELKARNNRYHMRELARLSENKKKEVLWREFTSRDEAIARWVENSPVIEDLKEPDRERGLKLDVALEAGMKIGVGKLNGYIVFHERENLVARKFNDLLPGPKWWKQLVDEGYMFGESFVEIYNPRKLFITEGVFDCLRIPIGHSVAVLGSMLNEVRISKIEKIAPNVEEIVLAFDRDVKDSTLTDMKLSLSDLGYSVETLNWDRWDSEIKDLDELSFVTYKKDFYRFIGFTEREKQIILI